MFGEKSIFLQHRSHNNGKIAQPRVHTMKKTIPLLLFAAMTLCSCEKFTMESVETTDTTTSSEDEPSEPEGNTIVHINTDALGSYSRITCSLFLRGTKVKNINQASASADFGTVRATLEQGTYTLVAIAHNGEGNATISSPEKVTFYKNKCTDTASAYTTLEVTDEGAEKTVTPQRTVAMVRLHVNDEIPDSAQTIKLYYTGGSSTLDATTGYGCVNSRQTEERTMSTTLKDYDIYTFPHSDGKKLHLTVTVYDSHSNTLATKELNDIEVKQGYRTTCSVNLFSDSSDDNTHTTFTFDPTWDGETNIDF